MSTRCQSCGMPMNKDPQSGGTNMDGTKSSEFCSLCYKDGMFIHPDFSAKDMQNFCAEQISKNGVPRFVAWILTRGIPKLDRWREG